MTVQISATGGSVDESDFQYINFTVTLSEASLDAVSVNYRMLQGTALDTDLDNQTFNSEGNGTITFAPGETSKTVLIEANTDSLDEVDESVVLELYNPTVNATFAGGTPVLRTTGIILDNDGVGSNLALFVSDPVLVEGDSGTTFANFEVTLSQNAPSTLVMNYTTADISAEAGSDYTATSGTVVFSTGEQTKTVSVPVIGDMIGEGAEKFALIVTPPGSPLINTDGATGEALILDTDTSPFPEISIEGGMTVESDFYYLRYVVTLSEPSLDAVTVNYRMLPGTGLDTDLDNQTFNNEGNGTLAFLPGETTKSIFIETNTDSLDERDEHVVMELYDPSANAVFSGGVPTLRSTSVILDNDGAGPNLAVFVSDPVITEGDSGQQMAVFEVKLSQPATSTLTFDFETSDITAKAGSDYIAQSGSLTFAPGQQTQAVAVPILGDTTGEAAETFALSVTPTSGASIGTDGATGQALILDTDQSPFPEISVEGGVTLESDFYYIRYIVTLSEPSLDAITVDYRMLQGTGSDTDLDNNTFNAEGNGTLTFSPGQTTKSIFIEANTDSLDERDEHVVLELVNPSGNAVFAGGTPTLRSTGIILDDDGVGPNLAIFVSDPVVTEGDSGQTLAVFDIQLSQPASVEFDVTYTTTDISAKAGEDYTARSGTLTFAPGQQSLSVEVPVLGDNAGEGSEKFGLVVSLPGSPSIGNSGASGEALILDTDSTILPEITVEGGYTLESDFYFIRYVVSLSEASASEVSVNWNMVEGVAVAGDLDNGLQFGSLTFAPGQTTKSIYIEANTDSVDERDESIYLRLTDPVNAAFGSGETELYATGFIIDNDGGGPNRMVAGEATQVAETGAEFTDYQININLSEANGSEVTFDASLVSGSGTVGTDITLLDPTVTFAPGQTSASVGVRVFSDASGEGAETVELTMTPASGVPFVGVIGNTTITIADGPEPQVATNGNDTLVGTLGHDSINLRNGNDVYNGLAGDDVVTGGAGDDIIDGGLGSDTASYLSATSGVNVYLLYTGRNVGGAQGRDTLIDIENLTGSDFGDRLIGDGNDNVLTGWLGDDVLKGKGGNDTFFGGDGDDKIRSGDGTDAMYGGDGTDILIALDGNDVLEGGNDRDFLYGGRGNDIVRGDAGDDELRGNRGNDVMFGGDGMDDVRGGGNNDTLFGGNGRDFMFGEFGSDRLDGGLGDDVLTGGIGSGILDGTRDTFVFASTANGNGGFDRVKDFEDGIDLIDLSSFGFASFASVDALAFDQFGGLWIDFGGGDILFLEDMTKTDFDASDVIL